VEGVKIAADSGAQKRIERILDHLLMQSFGYT
jgi:hypothetical protein